ncbi:MAG: ribonuclease [Ferruginibacter sp.]|uniref:ribonuclease HI n=1 Tax=Ferruginibacter sp. TaxID=1940288 RepID=UPI00346663DE|nr:ribonuclease [Ferruginibacter sp.]
MALNPTKGLLVYTDGSYSNGGPGGWSWVAVDGFGEHEHDAGFIPPPTTNNRMEMEAQVQALDTLYAKYGACEMEIVSDSQYVVLGCQYPERARNANADIWARIETSAQLHDHVQWRHVRGHVGVKWNELADTLAVKARKEARWQSS